MSVFGVCAQSNPIAYLFQFQWANGFWLVYLSMRLWQLFMKVLTFLVVFLVVLHVSDPYSRTSRPYQPIIIK